DHKKLGKEASKEAEKLVQKIEGAPAGAKPQEVLSTSGDNVQIKIAPRQRPDVMQGITYRMDTAYGKLYVTINEDEQGPFEVFAQMGKSGGFFSAQTEAITRLISLALRSNVAIEEVIDQLKGIRGPDVSFSEQGMVFSLPDAVAKVLEKHIKRRDKQLALDLPATAEGPSIAETLVKQEVKQLVAESSSRLATQAIAQTQKKQKVSIANLGNAPVCPSCASMLVFAEGCMKCDSCGYSKCG
ncbi:MAG: hypothetical protein M1333_02845, partial [Patescibacteria group bacterium]|nr:hypothetical protein [Patescibacteria group bacterium]